MKMKLMLLLQLRPLLQLTRVEGFSVHSRVNLKGKQRLPLNVQSYDGLGDHEQDDGAMRLTWLKEMRLMRVTVPILRLIHWVTLNQPDESVTHEDDLMLIVVGQQAHRDHLVHRKGNPWVHHWLQHEMT